MKRAALGIVVALAVLTQVSFLPFVRPLGVVPNLVLVVVALMALRQTASFGLFLAVLAGLAVDLSSGVNFGLWTGLLTLAVLVSGLIRQAGIELDELIVAGVMILIGTLAFNVVSWLSLINQTGHWPVGWLLSRFGAELVLNWGLMILLRPLLRRLQTLESGG